MAGQLIDRARSRPKARDVWLWRGVGDRSLPVSQRTRCSLADELCNGKRGSGRARGFSERVLRAAAATLRESRARTLALIVTEQWSGHRRALVTLAYTLAFDSGGARGAATARRERLTCGAVIPPNPIPMRIKPPRVRDGAQRKSQAARRGSPQPTAPLGSALHRSIYITGIDISQRGTTRPNEMNSSFLNRLD